MKTSHLLFLKERIWSELQNQRWQEGHWFMYKHINMKKYSACRFVKHIARDCQRQGLGCPGFATRPCRRWQKPQLPSRLTLKIKVSYSEVKTEIWPWSLKKYISATKKCQFSSFKNCPWLLKLAHREIFYQPVNLEAFGITLGGAAQKAQRHRLNSEVYVGRKNKHLTFSRLVCV